MAKKVKVPLALRVVRWLFPRLEKISPPFATRLFVQLFFTPLHYGFPDIEKKWIETSNRSNIISDGKKIQIYSWGAEQNPFILFVHGWAGRGTQFINFFPTLMSNGYRVIAFDGPAHGLSDGKRTNILEFEKVLNQIFQKYGEPVSVITHSFGGVATLMSISNGMIVKRLINIGTPSIGDEIIRTFLKAVNGSWSTAESFKRYMVKKYGHSFDEFSGEYFIQKIKELDILLVHDEQDKDVPIAHAERVMELYPKAKIYRTTGLGHTRILRDEGVVNECLAFIKRNG